MKAENNTEVTIIDYNPLYRQAFHDLNVSWISRYFKMEEADYKALDHPEEYILDKGGAIIFALDGDEAVGTCALIKMDDSTVELAKMAVRDDQQGRGIGYLLGVAALQKAKEMGAKRVFLESNTKLTPAITLYYKLGFKRLELGASPYERADIQMELLLD